MKKLILILILSFLASTGYSGVSYPASSDDSDEPSESAPSIKNCPDGSAPVKSVSDDGFYFVFKCGGATEVPTVSPEAEVSSETTSDKSAPADLGEDDYIEKIKEAKALFDSGVISEEQFEKMKQKIIDNI